MKKDTPRTNAVLNTFNGKASNNIQGEPAKGVSSGEAMQIIIDSVKNNHFT